MGTQDSAEYYREYRRKNKARINAKERERRQSPEVKKARHVAETARRRRIRERLAAFTVETYHPLYDKARKYLGMVTPSQGVIYQFDTELFAEDLLHEVVICLLTGVDPVETIKRLRSERTEYGLITCPLIDEN